MEDAAAMGVFQRTGNLNGKAKRLVGWQWTLQAPAFDVLENQIPLADVVDLTDMWVIQRRNGAGFLIEAVAVRGRLIATMRLRRVSRAFHTSPIPPAPSGDTSV
jgi:hypothetical protein